MLSKLGLDQFAADDLRYLEIYASIAAQAMANADVTEQLRGQSESARRQLRSQRELLRVTESILASLDPHVVLDEIATRLVGLVPVDNIGIDKLDRVAGEFVPVVARGVDAAEYRGRRLKMDEGVAGWVAEHGEGQLILDELADPRVAFFDDVGPQAGSLIVVPLRGRDGTVGVLTLERLGTSAAFTTEEFELVQLFAAQASIAMQNAELHADVVVQAQTDGLTGLFNHATFTADLERAVASSERFGLIMLDLDDFKGFNDTHGHPTGDLLLQGIARALTSAGRDFGPRLPLWRRRVRAPPAGRGRDRRSSGRRSGSSGGPRRGWPAGGERGAGSHVLDGRGRLPERWRGRGGHPGCRRPSLLPGQADWPRPGRHGRRGGGHRCRHRAQRADTDRHAECTEVGRLSGPPRYNASPVGTIAG